MNLKERFGVVGEMIFWTSMVCVLIFGVIAFFLWVRPLLLNQYTKGIQHSYEYVETKQELLLKLVSDYEKLDTEISTLRSDSKNDPIVEGKKGQQKAIVDRIKLEKERLQTNQVPPKVVQFLATRVD